MFNEFLERIYLILNPFVDSFFMNPLSSLDQKADIDSNLKKTKQTLFFLNSNIGSFLFKILFSHLISTSTVYLDVYVTHRKSVI
jgi:hypothetical protein